MAQAFYNRFSNKVSSEAFSSDVVYTAFNNTDADYLAVAQADCRDTTCDTSSTSLTYANNYTKCQCNYREKVDKLTKLKDTKDTSQKNLDDNGEIYSSITMDTINLGIGISMMLGTIYYMNQ